MIRQFFQRDSTLVLGRHRIPISASYKQTLLLAVVAAVLWWCFAVWLRANSQPGTVWVDQEATFLNINVRQPYQTPGLVNPPWVVVVLLPLQGLSLGGGVLVQWLLYAAILVGLIYRFGGNTPFWTLLIVVTSPLALDNAVELNIDWIVGLGLLVPPAYSAPFLLVKPQNALGYVLSFKWEDLIRWLTVLLVTITLSFMIWGNWVQAWLASANNKFVVNAVNMAPMHWAGTVPALIMGGVILLAAMRLPTPDYPHDPDSTQKYRWHRPDALLSILAGLCFVPYMASYTGLLALTLIAIRYPRLALLISLTMWLVLLNILNQYGFFAPGGVRI